VPAMRVRKQSRGEFTVGIREIASRAKVSIATVSRTLNNVSTVSRKSAKRIWNVANKLNYYPNNQARALASGHSRMVGLIVADLTDPFFSEIVHIFQETALQHNYEVLITSTQRQESRMSVAVQRMLECKIEGVVVMTSQIAEVHLQELTQHQVPLVLLGGPRNTSHSSNIQIDFLSGIRQAAQHLVALRHERIAFITGPLVFQSSVARRDAFLRSMRELAMAVDRDLIVEGDHTPEGGERALEQLLKLVKMPTAILCSNDMTALGVMRKCFGEGIDVPQDLSVIGFDNIRISEYMSPALTTIDLSQERLAKTAFLALMKDISGNVGNALGTQYDLKTNLILRETTHLNLHPEKETRKLAIPSGRGQKF
jgi:DNA-binding LacI/PurR family transcriptional regulator